MAGAPSQFLPRCSGHITPVFPSTKKKLHNFLFPPISLFFGDNLWSVKHFLFRKSNLQCPKQSPRAWGGGGSFIPLVFPLPWPVPSLPFLQMGGMGLDQGWTLLMKLMPAWIMFPRAGRCPGSTRS